MGATFDSPERRTEARRGNAGPQGARGNGFVYGTTAPPTAVGVPGDFYFDTVLLRIYGPKLEEGWPLNYAQLSNAIAVGEAIQQLEDIITQIGEATAEGIAALVVSKLDVDFSNLTSAKALREAGGIYIVTPEDHGARPDDEEFDNSEAILLAEAERQTNDGVLVFKQGANYYFAEQLEVITNKLAWIGERTSLIYNGIADDIDLLVIGDGAAEYDSCTIRGISIRSLTVMTDGYAARAKHSVRSTLQFESIQGQLFASVRGNNLWNGVYADCVDNVPICAEDIYVQNVGASVRGTLGAGPKANCWLNVRKIGECAIGVLMGGGFGGLQLCVSDFIENGVNVQFDQSLQAEENRELFFNGTMCDSATGAASIIHNDPGNILVQMTGVWNASSAGHGFWIKAGAGGKIGMVNQREFNHAGDGIRNDSNVCVVNIVGGQIHDNDGWGINPTVAGHHTGISSVHVFANTLGQVRTTYAPASRPYSHYAQFFDLEVTTLNADAMFVDQVYIDSKYILFMSGGVNPGINYDDNDYSIYSRANNRYEWFVGGGQVGALSQAGLAIGPGNDALLARQAANTIAMRNGANAQGFWLHNTYTDPSNHEALKFYFTSNIAVIRTEQAGTGVNRDLYIGTGGAGQLSLMSGNTKRWNVPGGTGHFLAEVHNTYDIGSGSNDPRNIFAATALISAGYVRADSGGGFYINGRSKLQSPADGVFALYNNALTDFGRLQFGGTTSSFPALKKVSNVLAVRLADDSGPAGFTAAYLSALSDTGSLRFGVADDLFLTRDAADVLAQRRSTNAQAFRLYNTYTDASNYERGSIGWSGNNFDLTTVSAGTGTARNMRVYAAGTLSLGAAGNAYWIINTDGRIFAQADNLYDIGGTSTNRPRSIYAGTDVYSGLNARFSWGGSRSGIYSPSDGVIGLYNFAASDFGRLQFGGTTASFPALKRSTTELHARLADDSAFASLHANFLYARGGIVNIGAAFEVTLVAEAANVLAQRNATNAQTFRLYNTYTDPSNFERGTAGWSSNVFVVGTQNLGTGVARAVQFQMGSSNIFQIDTSGHTIWNTDAAYNIGALGANRPNNLYLAGDARVQGFLRIGGDTTLYREASGQLAQRNAAVNQFYFLYETYTDASNFARLALWADAAGAHLRQQYVGTGTYLPIELTGSEVQFYTGANVLRGKFTDTAFTTTVPVVTTYLSVDDGVAAPGAGTGKARIYVDAADGDLKIVFADGTVKTIVTDT